MYLIRTNIRLVIKPIGSVYRIHKSSVISTDQTKIQYFDIPIQSNLFICPIILTSMLRVGSYYGVYIMYNKL